MQKRFDGNTQGEKYRDRERVRDAEIRETVSERRFTSSTADHLTL